MLFNCITGFTSSTYLKTYVKLLTFDLETLVIFSEFRTFETPLIL